MTKRLFISIWALAVSLTVYFAAIFAFADGGRVIISYEDNFKAFAASDFVKRLTALPEWEPFFEAFTKSCDKAIDKELSRENLQRRLPEPVVNDLRTFLESGISTKKGIETVFQHLEAVIFKLQADFDDDEIDENLQDITDLVQGQKEDLDLNFDGLLAFIIDVNPRFCLSFLKYFREKIDYQFLRNEPDGDFILKFDFEFYDRDIEFCCAGIKLNTGRYAILFSDDDQIVPYYKAFKNGNYDKTDTTLPKKELVLEETCFLFLDRQLKRANLTSNGAEFLGKIRKVKTTLHEVNGVSQFEITAVMRTGEDARAVRDLLTGLLAFVQLSVTENSPERGLLQTIQINAAGTNVSVTVKLDNPELWKLIARQLQQITEKIENRQ
ncbi:MAG: hypothetical protein LBU34_02015 [Planctomycetaceae bacterium]|jgi:hypothetical protein|nr:hypothetical protein [Planctomycetaceae bacterium]